MAADIIRPGCAAAIAVEAGQRVVGAGLQHTAQHIQRLPPSATAIADIPRHSAPPFRQAIPHHTPCGREPEPASARPGVLSLFRIRRPRDGVRLSTPDNLSAIDKRVLSRKCRWQTLEETFMKLSLPADSLPIQEMFERFFA